MPELLIFIFLYISSRTPAKQPLKWKRKQQQLGIGRWSGTGDITKGRRAHNFHFRKKQRYVEFTDKDAVDFLEHRSLHVPRLKCETWQTSVSLTRDLVQKLKCRKSVRTLIRNRYVIYEMTCSCHGEPYGQKTHQSWASIVKSQREWMRTEGGDEWSIRPRCLRHCCHDLTPRAIACGDICLPVHSRSTLSIHTAFRYKNYHKSWLYSANSQHVWLWCASSRSPAPVDFVLSRPGGSVQAKKEKKWASTAKIIAFGLNVSA